VPARAPDAQPAAVEARAAPTAQAPRRLGLALAVIATAQLMVALDLTIVNVGLPQIQAALHFSGSNLECPTPRPPRKASRTGAMPRWSQRWRPPRCCWRRSRWSRTATP
jgi:hypothetical protein